MLNNFLIQRCIEFETKHQAEPRLIIINYSAFEILEIEVPDEVTTHPDGGFLWRGIRILRSRDLEINQLIMT